MLKTTDSLDTIGYFTLHFSDLRRIFDVVHVQGSNFPLSSAALSDISRQEKTEEEPWRVAVVKTHTWEYAPPYAQRALNRWAEKLAEACGMELDEKELPEGMDQAHEIHATIYNKTLSYYFKEEFKRGELVSPIMKDLIREGNAITTEAYLRALHTQQRLATRMDGFFRGCDLLLSLATAGEAPLREKPELPDPALQWTLTHLPVICAPVFRSPRGLPFGVQLVARRYNDYLLFHFAEHLRTQRLIPEGPYPRISE